MNILFPPQAGLNGVTPVFRFLDASAEELNVVTNPGFLNSILAMGNIINPSDLLLVAYKGGTQIFQQSVSDGIITLEVYSPGDNSFTFTHVQFVAKGGSDLNAGNTLGAPKLTIQSAIDALPSTNGSFYLVIVTDSGNYTEHLVAKQNLIIWAPNATLTNTTGTLLTLPNLGVSYQVSATFALISASGGAGTVSVLGASSALNLETQALVGGAVTLQGNMFLKATQVTSVTTNIAATGQLIAAVMNASSSPINVTTGGNVIGNFADSYYGTHNFKNKMTFQQDESQETVGRTLTIDDGVTTIQYNSMSDGTFTLPQTSSVAIPVGSVVSFVQVGAGAINFVADLGVTLGSPVGSTPQTSATWAKAFAEKLTDTVWVVSGDIQAVGP